MRVTEPQLRTVTLAQAIELADTQRTLVSPPELDDALQAALAAARARGVVRVGVGDIVLDRAAAIVQRASGRDATVAALQEPGARLRWLAVALLGVTEALTACPTTGKDVLSFTSFRASASATGEVMSLAARPEKSPVPVA